MGFFIFMLIFSLLIPAIMILFGRAFIKAAPKDINPVFGYRTTMSMKNQDTWTFAHRYCGRLWLYAGLIMLVPTLVALGIVAGQGKDIIGAVGSTVVFVQLAILLISILPTERALRRTFDRDGVRR